MPTPFYALTMARYNLWQNTSLMTATDSLPAQDRQADRGAFFGSIEKTFYHLYWADRVWMSRFSASPAPGGGLQDSVAFPGGWAAFRDQRRAQDLAILDWAAQLEAGWFDDDGAAGRTGAFAPSRAERVIQMFNHQTHHRGQIHAMLTAAGARPEDTDVFRTPAAYRALPG